MSFTVDLQPKNLKELCKAYDVDWEPEIDEDCIEPMRRIDTGDVGEEINSVPAEAVEGCAGGLEVLASEFQGEHGTLSLSDVTDEQTVPFGGDYELSGGPFDEIGAPGVRVVGGVLSQEPRSKYRPYQVRGHVRHHGLYEEYYRAEPVLWEGINEGNNLFIAGDLRFVEPDVPDSQQSAAREFTEWCNGWWRRIWRGPTYYQRHAGAAKIFGFYGFEVVWTVDDYGRVHPAKLAPREPSTFDKWIFSPRGDTLEGATFRLPSVSGGARHKAKGKRHAAGAHRYTLTARGPALTDHRLHIANVHNRANNVEGISYVRPVLHWIKFKQVLHQIAAVTAQKYGVPMAVIQREPIDRLGASADQKGGSQIFTKVAGQQANEAPVYQLEPGWGIELLSPGGQMPTLRELLDYADQMIAKPTSSEAGLLGKGKVGSYALSEVLDNKLLRAQPGFAADVTQSLNWMIRDIARWHGVELDEYPVCIWEMDAGADSSKWLSDATQAMDGLPIWQWPEEMRQAALRKLDISEAAFKNWEAPERTTPRGDSQSQQFSVSHKPQDFHLGDAIRMRRGGVRGDGTADEYRLQDAINGSLDASNARGQLERGERRIARDIESIAQDHRRTFRDEVRDGPLDLQEADEVLRRIYLPQYEQAIRDGMDSVADDGRAELLRNVGLSIAEGVELPQTGALDDVLDAAAYDIAEEVFGRQQGLMRRSVVEDAQAGEETGVPMLEMATLAVISRGAVSRAYNAGRDDIMEVADQVEEDLPPIVARRSSMLDESVCENCKALDFQEGDDAAVHLVGSQAYYDDMPPRHCKGGNKCRCVYIYEIPSQYEGTLEEIARNQDFELPPASRRAA